MSQNNEIAAILVSQTNPVGVELLSEGQIGLRQIICDGIKILSVSVFVLLLFLPASDILGVVVYNIHILLSSTRTRLLSVVLELSFP